MGNLRESSPTSVVFGSSSVGTPLHVLQQRGCNNKPGGRAGRRDRGSALGAASWLSASAGGPGWPLRDGLTLKRRDSLMKRASCHVSTHTESIAIQDLIVMDPMLMVTNWASEGMNMTDDYDYMLSLINMTDRFSLHQQQLNFPSSTSSPEGSTVLTPTAATKQYCGEGLETFRQHYLLMHGYTALVVCLFGFVANTLNIVVLTRMDQKISPTNAILTGLALADNFVMIEYIPFAFHMYILRERPVYEKFSYPWTVYVLIHAHVTQVFHTISIWLTLLLAVWRYISVAHPLRSRDWCTLDRALLAILLAYVCSPFVCIPLYLTFTIQEQVWRPQSTLTLSSGLSPSEVPERTLYFLGTSELAKANHSLLENINFWTYSVVVKLIPCLALTILSFQLIRALVSARERRQNLKTHNNSSVVPGAGGLQASKKSVLGSSKERPQRTAADVERGSQQGSEKHDRTTRMLLAVLFLFLLTEFPQGILALLSGILGDAFFSECYGHLGELMDILALINSAINFILYCLMSRQFRQTFHRIFRPRLLDKWTAVPLTAVPPSTLPSPSVTGRMNAHSIVATKSSTRANNLIGENAPLNPDPVVV